MIATRHTRARGFFGKRFTALSARPDKRLEPEWALDGTAEAPEAAEASVVPEEDATEDAREEFEGDC